MINGVIEGCEGERANVFNIRHRLFLPKRCWSRCSARDLPRKPTPFPL